MADQSENRHPSTELRWLAEEAKLDVKDPKFAQLMDDRDELQSLRGEFNIPKMGELHNTDLSLVNASEDCVYMCGNGLGLCPKKTKAYMEVEIDKWSKLGHHGRWTGDLPWGYCDEVLEEDMTKIVGCNKEEIALMNGVTVNLHLMMISFYRPTKDRYKILCESKAFPSDHYTFESQSKLHGLNPKNTMICVEPREGEDTLRTEDILSVIEKEGDSIALVCLSGVQYYTGQFFDIPTITKAGQAKGCYVGWDLAHAVGNVPLYLHDWNVDFACWCSYKYLCGSAGGFGGIFLHERHRLNDFPKLIGWTGHELSSRFVMDNKLVLSPGAHGYRISSPGGLLAVPLKASLEIFRKTNLEALRAKSLLLTGYLEMLIDQNYGRPQGQKAQDDGSTVYIDLLTPRDPAQRGAQLSLCFNVSIDKIFEELEKRGVVCYKELPSVIRVSPSPIYNSFSDVHRFIIYLRDALEVCKSTLRHL